MVRRHKNLPSDLSDLSDKKPPRHGMTGLGEFLYSDCATGMRISYGIIEYLVALASVLACYR